MYYTLTLELLYRQTKNEPSLNILVTLLLSDADVSLPDAYTQFKLAAVSYIFVS